MTTTATPTLQWEEKDEAWSSLLYLATDDRTRSIIVHGMYHPRKKPDGSPAVSNDDFDFDKFFAVVGDCVAERLRKLNPATEQ